jgi:hypothetical protein
MPGWTVAFGSRCVKIGMSFARRVRPGGAMVGCLAGRYRGRVPCVRMRVRLHPGAPGHAPAIAWPRAVRASSSGAAPRARRAGGQPEDVRSGQSGRAKRGKKRFVSRGRCARSCGFSAAAPR